MWCTIANLIKCSSLNKTYLTFPKAVTKAHCWRCAPIDVDNFPKMAGSVSVGKQSDNARLFSQHLDVGFYMVSNNIHSRILSFYNFYPKEIWEAVVCFFKLERCVPHSPCSQWSQEIKNHYLM